MLRLGKNVGNVLAAGRRAASSLPEPQTSPDILYTGVSIALFACNQAQMTRITK